MKLHAVRVQFDSPQSIARARNGASPAMKSTSMTIIAQQWPARERCLASCRKLIDKTSHGPVHLSVWLAAFYLTLFFSPGLLNVALSVAVSRSPSFDTEPDTDPTRLAHTFLTVRPASPCPALMHAPPSPC